MYIHKRKWFTTWKPDLSAAGQRLQALYGVAPRIYFRLRYDEGLNLCFARVHAEDRAEYNYYLDCVREWSANPQGYRVKLAVRGVKRPHGYSAKMKPFARRTSRRLAKQYLAQHWTEEDFNHRFNPGVKYWD